MLQTDGWADPNYRKLNLKIMLVYYHIEYFGKLGIILLFCLWSSQSPIPYFRFFF